MSLTASHRSPYVRLYDARLEATVAFVVAGAAGAAAVVAPSIVAALVLGLIAAVLWASGRTRTKTTVVALAALPIVAGAAHYGRLLPNSVSRAQDAVLAAGLLAGLSALRRAEPATRRLLTRLGAVLIVSQMPGMIRSHGTLLLGMEATWQDLRWIGALGWGIYLGRHLTRTAAYRWVYRLLVVWGAAQVVVSLAQAQLGRVSGYRFSVPVVTGVFGHPTLASVAGTMLVLLSAAERAAQSRFLSRRQSLLGIVIGLLTIITSTRTKPVLALVAAVLVYLTFRLTRDRVLTAIAFVAVPLFFFMTLPFASQLDRGRDQNTSLVANITAHAVPRATLIDGAKQLADQSFPLGWGVGTFGSNLNQQTETRSFSAAGLGNVWGFSAANPAFRFDSLAAHVLAERGWIGVVLWLTGFVLLFRMTMRASPLHFFPAAVITAALALAPVTPSLHDATLALLMLVPVGMCLGSVSDDVAEPLEEDTFLALERRRTP